MALRIIFHAFRMIFDNFGEALKISVGPCLICLGAVHGHFTLFDILDERGEPLSSDLPLLFWVLNFFYIPLALLSVCLLSLIPAWVAVSWHRSILLHERAKLLPAIKILTFIRYTGRFVMIGLLAGAAVFPIIGIWEAVLHVLHPNGGPLASGEDVLVVRIGVMLFLIVASLSVLMLPLYLLLRWGVSLVGTAIGEPLGIFKAWHYSKPLAITLVWVALGLLIFNLLPQVALGFLALRFEAFVSEMFFAAFITAFGVFWLTMMLNLSALTALYRHCVEGAELSN